LTPASSTLYRGIATFNRSPEEVATIIMNNAIWKNLAFLSTTDDPEVAYKIAGCANDGYIINIDLTNEIES